MHFGCIMKAKSRARKLRRIQDKARAIATQHSIWMRNYAKQQGGVMAGDTLMFFKKIHVVLIASYLLHRLC